MFLQMATYDNAMGHNSIESTCVHGKNHGNHVIQWFRVSCPDCALLTAINHVITVLEWQSLA